MRLMWYNAAEVNLRPLCAQRWMMTLVNFIKMKVKVTIVITIGQPGHSDAVVSRPVSRWLSHVQARLYKQALQSALLHYKGLVCSICDARGSEEGYDKSVRCNNYIQLNSKLLMLRTVQPVLYIFQNWIIFHFSLYVLRKPKFDLNRLLSVKLSCWGKESSTYFHF